MKKVPDMISTKDCAYITDMFNWNITIYKKLCEYGDNVSCKELKDEVNRLIKLHSDNCSKLVKYLEGWVN